MRKRDIRSGFSLLEITVVLTVLAVLSTMGIKVYQEQDYSKKTEETRTRLDRLEGALANYRNTYHRYPCPANPTLKLGDTGYGYEGQNPGNCTDGSPATSFVASNTVAGMIPVRTMQLPDEMAYDAWGRRFTYAVDRRMTHIQAAFKYKTKNCTIGDITINDASGNARSSRGIYALVSHGENGHGAYLANGTVRNAKSANASELVNANLSSNIYVMRREVRASASLFNRFDDLVRYKERWAAVNAADIAINGQTAMQYFTQLAGQWPTSCALHSSGNVYCWGDNASGQLGDGTVVNKLVPTKVIMPAAISSFTKIAVGGHDRLFNCAIGNNNQIYCWGNDTRGQLGDGSPYSNVSQPTNPVILPVGVSYWKSVYAGNNHACAIADTDDTYCWGDNNHGKLGDGVTTSGRSHTPIKVATAAAGIAYFTEIGVGDKFTCGLANTGLSYCWGEGPYLGNGTTTDYNVPRAVTHPGGVLFTSISAGGEQAAGLRTDGRIYYWNPNPPYSPQHWSIGLPTGVTSFNVVSVGGDDICGIANTGNAYCVGSYPGQGTDNKVDLPVSGVSVTQVQAGCWTVCVLGSNKKMYCWGENSQGSVGDGTTTARNSPVYINESALCD